MFEYPNPRPFPHPSSRPFHHNLKPPNLLLDHYKGILKITNVVLGRTFTVLSKAILMRLSLFGTRCLSFAEKQHMPAQTKEAIETHMVENQHAPTGVGSHDHP
ncbi:hypothetical protein Fmac_028856 [Flemingia macrophylla]|uniref:Uncharacterized protein n=1 Tax=Flemingia macrophylla TaxID=520843 RepID=A0ABD1L8N7_9FABA